MTSMIEQFASSLSFESVRGAKDLHKRIIFTLLMLVVYRLGTYIPIPGVNPEVLSEFIRANSAGILGVFDMFSGGALSRMTILALGLSPYISSSIIIQLVSKLIPKFEYLTKEGEQGRRKMNTYTRYLTVALAAVQGFGVSILIEQMGGMVGLGSETILINIWLFRLVTMLSIMGGTLFLMWLGEQITSRGLGNGISTLIYAGIVANLPSSLISAFTMGREEGVYYIVPLLLVMSSIIFAYVVFVEKAQRRIPIQYPRRNAQEAMSMPNYLPLKVNISGVMPPIFAQALLSIPILTIGSIAAVASNDYVNMFLNLLKPGGWFYMTAQLALVVFFSFFYTSIMFNTKETADNLKKGQAYIPGIRPGEQTQNYLSYVVNRITVVGAIYLASICVIPSIVQAHVSLNSFFGGTSILIVVSVTIETISQIQTHLFANQYKGLLNRKKK